MSLILNTSGVRRGRGVGFVLFWTVWGGDNFGKKDYIFFIDRIIQN